MLKPTAQQLIEHLQLCRHPEGGWFRESYRSTETVPAEGLPDRFAGRRTFSTAIYFLLQRGDFSALHRIKSDEIWHFYAGDPLLVQVITPEGVHREIRLGADLSAGESFQASVPAGCWFGAELAGEGEFALVGCTVAPGFDFDDFEMGERRELSRMLPAQRELIERLTR